MVRYRQMRDVCGSIQPRIPYCSFGPLISEWRSSLAIRIPYSDGELEGGARFSLSEGSKLDIYALDEPKSINVQRLSWASRPPRRERVATVESKSGEEITVSWFACPWSSLHTFEIACADGQTVDCMVDVWTSQNKTWGAFMYQHQTV